MLDQRCCARCNTVKKCIDFPISVCYSEEPPYVCKACLEKSLKQFQLLEDVDSFI